MSLRIYFSSTVMRSIVDWGGWIQLPEPSWFAMMGAVRAVVSGAQMCSVPKCMQAPRTVGAGVVERELWVTPKSDAGRAGVHNL
jgi:hypothetical protein